MASLLNLAARRPNHPCSVPSGLLPSHVMGEHNPPATHLGRQRTGEEVMIIKRVAGAIGAELQAVNLGEDSTPS